MSVDIAPSLLETPRFLPLVEVRASRAMLRWAVCGAMLIVLVGWAVLFPYTGDGDSVLHYLNARDAIGTPVSALHAWARPGAKLLMMPFAMRGILPTRCGMAVVAVLTAWQTIRLAEDLRIPRALLAGPLLLWQPLAFALASDTMTEIPMALGIVCAIRLWRNGFRQSSAILIGFLPMVRPEGFFLGVLWGIMVLTAERPDRSVLWINAWCAATLGLMTLGLLTWAVACWALTFNHDPLYVLHIWNWPPGSYAAYGRGSLLHHVIRWPEYGGLPLTILFVLGIRPAWRLRTMRLPWAVWLLVFGVHTILYWRGWFASCGLMRILACTAPITALICLHGWNVIARWLVDRAEHREIRSPSRYLKIAGILGGLICTGWVFAQYALDPGHYECFPINRCVRYIRANQLLGPETWFFTGNHIATAELNLPPHPEHLMETPCDTGQIRQNLTALPIGSIGIWDNRQAPVWHGHQIEDLTNLGFTILFDTRTLAPTFRSLFNGDAGSVTLRYVVLRKVR